MPARPAPKKAAPVPCESMDDGEPLLGDDDVPMRNGPRGIADDEDEVAAAPQLVRPAPPAVKSGGSGRAPVPAPAAKAPTKVPPRAPVQPETDVNEDGDIDFDIGDEEIDVTAATREMPAAKPAKPGLPAKAARSAKPASDDAKGSGRRTLNAKRPAPVEEDEEVDAEDKATVRASKRSTRQSVRSSGKSAAGNGVPKLYLIGGGVGVLLLMVVLLGYKPFMKMQYTKAVVDGATVDERKEGAGKLIDAFPDHAFTVFSEHVASSNAPLRETAIHGLGLIGKEGRSERANESQRRSEALEKLADGMKGADAGVKKLTLKALGGITEKVSVGMGKGEDGKLGIEDKQAAQLADALLPLTEPAGGGDMDIRRESLTLLSKLRTPRVCKQMIKLASSDAELKDAARAAIAQTALPDAAGDLLRAMTSTDKALADAAKNAFVVIRDSAPSKDILPLVGDPSADVRREIVEALGKRKGDSVAAQGITKALKDADPSIRLLAVNAVPTTGVSGAMSQLGDLSKDTDEKVRIASGEVLGKLRDSDSYTVLLETFKNNLEGKTLEAYVKALGARARGKDMKNIGMAIGLLDSNPGAESSICEALMLLSNNGVGPQRDAVRKVWKSAQWKQWYAKINEREKMRAEANAMVKEATSNRNADRKTFVKWKGMVEKAMELYEKAQAMCQPDDAEDAKSFDNEIKQASVAKEYFIKGASFDLR